MYEERLERKFTREVIRSGLNEITKYFHSGDYTNMARFSVWFAVFNVPIKYDTNKNAFIVLDKSVQNRFISEEDEALFLELNDLYAVNGKHTDQYNLRAAKMKNILFYFEMLQYTCEFSAETNRYELKGISD